MQNKIFAENLKLFGIAVNLGALESPICRPF